MADDNDSDSVMQHALTASRRRLAVAIQGIEETRTAETGDGVIPIRSVCSADAAKFSGLLEALKTCQTV